MDPNSHLRPPNPNFSSLTTTTTTTSPSSAAAAVVLPSIMKGSIEEIETEAEQADEALKGYVTLGKFKVSQV